MLILPQYHSQIIKPGLGARLDPDHPLNRGLVGDWPLNEGGGTVVRDWSGNNHHATAEWGCARVPGGIESAGNSVDQIVLDSPITVGPNLTVFARLRLDSIYRVVFGGVGYNDGGYAFYTLSEDSIYVSFDGSYKQLTATGMFSGGVTRDYVITKHGTLGSLYIDGVWRAANNGFDAAKGLVAGCLNGYTGGQAVVDGVLERMTVWDRALTPNEIADLSLHPWSRYQRPVIEIPMPGAATPATEIASWADLAGIADLAGQYALTADLDADSAGYADYAGAAANSNTGWLPIGAGSTTGRFSGSFDGQGHTISGLVINRSADDQGLFGSVSGEIRNLSVLDVSITVTGSKSYIGALVGRNYGVISGCTVSGTVANAYRSTGGFVGENMTGASIRDCHSSVVVTAGADNAGGFVGRNAGAIADCSASGDVTGTVGVGGFVGQEKLGAIDRCSSSGAVGGTSAGYLGGFVGYHNGVGSQIRDCYSHGDVTIAAGVTTTYMGGFVGSNNAGNCARCYSTGAVHETGDDDPTGKGFCGVNGIPNGSAVGCFWDTETSGQATSAAGTGKTTAQMQTLATFTAASWDMVAIGDYDDETWFLDADSYPQLGWEYEEAGANYTGSGSVTVDKATVSASGTYTSSYTGSGSVIVQQPTASGSGTYATPVYTGSGSPQVTKVTASGAGAFTAPIYAGAGSVTVSKATASGSGLFANAFYSGSGGGTVRPPVAAGTGTFTVPAYSGVGDVSVTKVTASGTGLFAMAIYSGSGDVEVSKATAVGSGTFTVPTYECAGNVSIQKATVAGAGTFVVPTYEGYGSVSATKIVAAGSGLFATAIYNGSGDIAVSKVTVVGSGTFTVPTYSGSGSVSATKVTVVGSGLFAAEMYVGSISVTIARVEAVGVGTFAVPVYDGNGSVVVPQPAASGSGSFTAPVYSGLGVAVIRKATASGSGLHGLIFSGYGSVDTQRATASGAGTFFASGVSVASIFLLLKRKH